MSVEENKAAVQKFVEAINRQDYGLLVDALPDAENHIKQIGGVITRAEQG